MAHAPGHMHRRTVGAGELAQTRAPLGGMRPAAGLGHQVDRAKIPPGDRVADRLPGGRIPGEDRIALRGDATGHDLRWPRSRPAPAPARSPPARWRRSPVAPARPSPAADRAARPAGSHSRGPGPRHPAAAQAAAAALVDPSTQVGDIGVSFISAVAYCTASLRPTTDHRRDTRQETRRQGETEAAIMPSCLDSSLSPVSLSPVSCPRLPPMSLMVRYGPTTQASRFKQDRFRSCYDPPQRGRPDRR